jgi:superfamily II DNA or RNA helicase
MEGLPVEVILNYLCPYLHLEGVGRLSQTSHYFRDLGAVEYTFTYLLGLRDYQQQHVRTILDRFQKGNILCDSSPMSSGKTHTSIALASLLPKIPLVFALPTVIPHWEEVIASTEGSFAYQPRITSLYSLSRRNELEVPRESKPLILKQYRNGRFPPRAERYFSTQPVLLIVDEQHKIGCGKAGRVLARILELIRRNPQGRAILMSGTLASNTSQAKMLLKQLGYVLPKKGVRLKEKHTEWLKEFAVDMRPPSNYQDTRVEYLIVDPNNPEMRQSTQELTNLILGHGPTYLLRDITPQDLAFRLVNIEQNLLIAIGAMVRKEIKESPLCKILVTLNSQAHIETLYKALRVAGIRAGYIHARIVGKRRRLLLEGFQDASPDSVQVLVSSMPIISTGLSLDDRVGNRPRKLFIVPQRRVADSNQLLFRLNRGIVSKSKPNIYYVFLNPTHIQDAATKQCQLRVIKSLVTNTVRIRAFYQHNPDYYLLDKLEEPDV